MAGTTSLSELEMLDLKENIEITDINYPCIMSNFSDLSFKRESLQQLTTNALPPYVPSSPPDIPEADFSKFKYHYCTDCGDTFTLRRSLKFHLERRSILIKFPCDACKDVKLFYNRCNLLSHIRAHTDEGETADISKAVVTPLPKVLMDEIQSALADSPEEEMSTVATDLLELSIKEFENEIFEYENNGLSNTSNHKSSNDVEKSVDKKITNSMVKKVSCFDCKENFNTMEERAQHLTQNNKVLNMSNKCDDCDMICPSICFLKAHQRIHYQTSPYICPECGESPSPTWQTFQYHVKFKCYHNSRIIGYKCPLCKYISVNQDYLVRHMKIHTNSFIKCSFCRRTFKNFSTHGLHVLIEHPNEIPKPTYILKCDICNAVLINEYHMQIHSKSHIEYKYYFNCGQCHKLLEDISHLNDHLKSNHPELYKTISKAIEPITYLPISNNVNNLKRIQCILCNNMFLNYPAYHVHLNAAHLNTNQPCSYCHLILVNRKCMVEHGKKHLNQGSFSCLLCNNRCWYNAVNLDRHLMNHASKLQGYTLCPVCDIILKTPSDAINHLREEHMISVDMGTGRETNSRPNTPQEIFTCHLCGVSFGTNSEIHEHILKKHHIEDVNASESTLFDESKSDLFSENQNLKDGNLCTKCSYFSVDREDFKKHIFSHKTHKTSVQCQECGELFISEPCLEKHLQITHKITDTKKYIEQEGTNYLLYMF